MSLFPAYGGGGGRGRGGGGSNRRGRGSDGPSSSWGGMSDERGGGAPGQGHQGGGYRGGGGGYDNNRGRMSHHNNRRDDFSEDAPFPDDGGGGYNRQEGHEKHRKRHRSPDSRSGSSKKKKRKSRSRSRSPHASRHHHGHQQRHQDRDDRNRDSQHNEGHRNRNDNNGGNRKSRWDNGSGNHNQPPPPQPLFNHPWGQVPPLGLVVPPPLGMLVPPPGILGLGGPPPPGMWNPSPDPWVLDNDPFRQNPNQSNYHQQGRDYYDNRGRGNDSRRDYDRGRGGGGRDRDHRGGESYGAQEDRRLRMSQNFPRKVFLEEVDLPTEFAFRVDTSCNPAQVNHRSLGMQQKSTYQFGRGIFGASEDEMSKVYSVFHSFRCKMPDVDDDDDDDSNSADESEGISKDRSLTVAKDFISLGHGQGDDDEDKDGRIDISKAFDTYSLERKEGEMSIKQRIEYFNKEVRNQPQNISLWKEFVRFQDKVIEQLDETFDQQEESLNLNSRKKKKKSNRKSLLEKKISILEKALETNPKNLELHLLRLDYLLEVFKPRHVLNEWKKLVTQYQQMAPFWIEYLLFSASDLVVYSNSSTVSIFETCFQKFRLMMNPQYPEFQRPKKFPLFISDITFAFSLLLKNAGFMERAVAVHQAQLEFDFFCPKNLFEDKTLLSWMDNLDVFENFWDSGTPRFGENGAKGWLNYVDNPPTDRVNIALPDSTIAEFEDDAFDSLNEELNSQDAVVKHAQKPNIWLNVESCRSKLYWLPWRVSCSDIEDCEDAQRVVACSDIKNFVCPVPAVNFISDFDRNAVHFRHVVNFLITLREDFLPHTQAVDLACSPFLSVSLTESSSLFSEIYYWRRLADLYVGTDAEPASKSQHVFAPEGFKLLDLVSPNLTTTHVLRPALFDISQQAGNLDDKRSNLLKQNDEKFMETFHRVVEKGIELLDPEFAGLLFEMFLRFEQKLTCTRSGDVKQRVKFAKGFMKQEKIRNSIGGYREMAMLEYFGGGTEKAIELLVKTIGITGKTLNLQEWDQVDFEKDWKSVVDLVSLYHQLVQLYLESNHDSKAYLTLIQLGNCFQPAESEASMDNNSEWKPKTNSLLKATRAFEKIMNILIPNFTCGNTKNEESEDDKDKAKVELLGSEVYFKYGGDKCVEFLLQQRNLIVEWINVYALFQFFSKDFDAASRVFENVLGRLSPEQLNRREGYNPELIRVHIREQLYISWCNLAARCLVKDPLMNSKFRNILGMALQEFPSSPPLLLLFTDVENQTSVAGKLWRLMMATMKQDSEKNVTHWAPLLMGIGLARKIEELERDEEVGLPVFGLGGPAVPQDTIFYKLDSMISVAEQHPGARNCPLLWRVHLKLLALRTREGKDISRAKATFFEAIRHCPSSKAIYLDGVTYFPELMHEVNDLHAEKQLLIRLPLEELDVLLDGEEVVEAVDDDEKEEVDEDAEDDVEEEEQEENAMEAEVEEGEASVKTKRPRESKSDGELGDSD